MVPTTSFNASRLIRRLREEAGLTQSELADRVGTTQSVISRLESDDYEGHSLSMLYRIGAALDRRIAVAAVGEHPGTLSVRERAPSYELAHSTAAAPDAGLSPRELDRLAGRLAQRFNDQGVTKADVQEAIRWARGDTGGRSVTDLRGAIKVGPGDVVRDVRRARAQRGRQTDRPR
ncbi:MAG: helix-turn-helix transcriptional regulator [Acidobacteriota bacterium]